MEHGGDLDRWLREAQVRFLRLGWVDSAGVLRTQAVSSARAAAMSAEGLGVVSGVQALPVFADVVQPGLGIGSVGQVWLRPDLEILRVLPWQQTHASTLGAFVTRDGSPWPFCPRTALLRAVARLERAGLSLQAAFEHEFLLLRRRDGALEHLEQSHYASAHGLNRAGPVLDATAQARVAGRARSRDAEGGRPQSVRAFHRARRAAARRGSLRGRARDDWSGGRATRPRRHLPPPRVRGRGGKRLAYPLQSLARRPEPH